ncbi:MAG: T9SS type A sorting domain-containing protein [Flavisolibacter sp.]
MRKQLFPYYLLFLAFFFPKLAHVQIVNSQDSLALVDLYQSTNGTKWKKNDNWLTTSPLGTWYGVTLNNGRVSTVNLYMNNLAGNLPATFGNISAIDTIRLGQNLLTGSIPESIGNYSQIKLLDLSQNLLGGSIPASIANIFPTVQRILLNDNQFTFSGMAIFQTITSIPAFYTPQANIPLIRDGNIISVAAGDTKVHNTYTWYKDGFNLGSKTDDSTLIVTTPGSYSVKVTSSTVPFLTLTSITFISQQDSLALVDLYNSLNGPGWSKKTNWLTTSPVATWYGVNVNFGRVHSINLSSNNLSGTLPSTISSLTSMSDIVLMGNEITGSIPISFGSLFQLSGLNLSDNKLTGPIPDIVGNLHKLSSLNLSGNQLTGAIPESISQLTNLNTLFLSDNQLGGSVPASWERLKNLVVLSISNNHLSGSIPDSLSYMTGLSVAFLNDNQLTGKLPDSIGRLSSLSLLALQNNQLNGPVPSSFKRITNAVITIQNNSFNFDGLEIPGSNFKSIIYSPQSPLSIHRIGTSLSVSAGGTVSNNTYKLFKDGALNQTKSGDSSFIITDVGKYHITIANSVAKQLILSTDTTSVVMVLAEKSTAVTTAVNGTGPVDVSEGIYKLIRLEPTSGVNALSGPVTTLVSLDTPVVSYNTIPYVERHYDITPANNASTSQATVTLYFTQADFDRFNTYVIANHLSLPLLPASGVDNGNVRITQYHGSFTGSSFPGNYASGAQTIIPSVSWDSDNSWWQVSFPVSGFSGFYLTTENIILPLSLLRFSGAWQNEHVNLHWSTAQEINTQQFVVERKNKGGEYQPVGVVPAFATLGDHDYMFMDTDPIAGDSYYRLQILDRDGKYVYSPILNIKVPKRSKLVRVYPNPVHRSTALQFNSTTVGDYQIEINDASGKLLKRILGKSERGKNNILIDLTGFEKGSYLISFKDLEHGIITVKVIKE